METTDLIKLADRFVNCTDRHVYLTGKAGTGKTTFLRELARTTHKRHVVVAPTGIAALNAQGVTIHSQFLLPLGTFLPDRDARIDSAEMAGCHTARTLVVKHPLNGPRRQVLRSIDLLIIDEVSMLRADILDAIDARLRSVRGNPRVPFGGVQLLLIGDLHQLPPVVKDNERQLMDRYYGSPHFFESWGLREAGYVHIELEKVFRQSDERFVALLNNLRNNTVTQDDIALLNSRYTPNAGEKDDGIVTLTTHNHTADTLNQAGLARLGGKAMRFRAEVDGDFPESAYPVNEYIELKVGAQVMFMKNDSRDGIYQNGTLAKVIELADDHVEVLLRDKNERYVVRQEVWQNKRYTVNERTRDLDEEVIGSYTQYPLRLAWAITVHKSQGLTFDRAIIDVGRAFAPGQVYVAMSRLRSLEGLMLRTRIDPNVVTTDPVVAAFNQKKDEQPPLSESLRQGQAHYLWTLITNTFSFADTVNLIENTLRRDDTVSTFSDSALRNALPELLAMLQAEEANTGRFRHQVHALLQAADTVHLLERVGKASNYYSSKLEEWMFHLFSHMAMVKRLSKAKTYYNTLSEVDVLLTKRLTDVWKVSRIAGDIINGTPTTTEPAEAERMKKLRGMLMNKAEEMLGDWKPEKGSSGRERKPKKSVSEKSSDKKPKVDTYKETLALFNQGLSLEEIAVGRGLKASTIETHLSKAVQVGDIRIDQALRPEAIIELTDHVRKHPEMSLGERVAALNARYSHGAVRMVLSHLNRSETPA